jgi:hypothetical protein
MVNRRILREDHLPAQIGRVNDRNQAKEADNSCENVITRELQKPKYKRNEVKVKGEIRMNDLPS